MTVLLSPEFPAITGGTAFIGELPAPGPTLLNTFAAPDWSSRGWSSALGVSWPADEQPPGIRMSDDDDDGGDDGDDDDDDDSFDEDGIELDDDTLAPTELEEFDEEDFDDEFDDDFEEEPEDEFGDEFGESESIGDLGIPDGDSLDEELSDGVDPIEPGGELKAVDDEDEEADEDEEDVE